MSTVSNSVNSVNNVNSVNSANSVNSVNSGNSVNSVNHTPGHLGVTVNKKIALDTRMQQSNWKYSWTTACDSQFENIPGHPRATVN